MRSMSVREPQALSHQSPAASSQSSFWTVAKYAIVRHSDPEPKAKGKNLYEIKILRSALGLPQDDKISISHQSPAVSHKSQVVRRNFFVLMLFSILYFLSSNCYAAPCYGVGLPQKKKFVVGVQSHTIFKRYLENSLGKVRSAQYFFLVSYGVWDWLSIDLKIGAGDIKQHPVGSDEIDYTSGFDGGYGYRVKLLDRNNFKTVFGFQHISVHPKGTHLGFVKNKAILDDWQYSLLAGYDFEKVSPYLGTRWSRVDYIHKLESDRKRKMSDLTKSVGLVFGVDLPIAEKVFINLEGSVFDSEAAAFSLNYKF